MSLAFVLYCICLYFVCVFMPNTNNNTYINYLLSIWLASCRQMASFSVNHFVKTKKTLLLLFHFCCICFLQFVLMKPGIVTNKTRNWLSFPQIMLWPLPYNMCGFCTKRMPPYVQCKLSLSMWTLFSQFLFEHSHNESIYYRGRSPLNRIQS